jgi:hypothetical protein
MGIFLCHLPLIQSQFAPHHFPEWENPVVPTQQVGIAINHAAGGGF